MTWDVTTPPGSEAKSNGDDRIREFKTDIQTALQVEGIFPVNPSSPAFKYRGGKGNTASRPANGSGGLYFNTDTGTLQRDNGSSWDDVGITDRRETISSGTGSVGNNINSTFYITSAVGSGVGFTMNRSGSIIGASVTILASSYLSTGTFSPILQKNESNFITLPTLSITGNGLFSITFTQSSGISTFVSGDRLRIKQAGSGGNINISCDAMIELSVSN